MVNDHIDGHYELYLLIFKMSNGSSYYEAYKRLLTPHVGASREKERKILPLILSLSFFHSLNSSFLFLPPLYIYIIKVIHSHPYFYLSHIYSHFSTLSKQYIIYLYYFICVAFILVLQYVINTNCSKGNSRILNLKLFI